MATSTSIAPPESGAPVEAALVACAECGGLNPPDSRFCRFCGAAVIAASAPPAPQANGTAPTPQVATAPPVAPVAPVIEPAVPAREVNDEAAEIDRRRAEQLLERAARLSERGDMGAAILATRQAVALAHSAPAYSLLGSFLERSNDVPGAMAAYEKVLQITPNSILERDALARLRETSALTQTGAGFHFNPNDLFSDAPPPETAQTPIAVEPLAPVTPTHADADATRPSGALLETSDLNPTGIGSINQSPAPVAPDDLAAHNATQAARHGVGEAPGTAASPDEAATIPIPIAANGAVAAATFVAPTARVAPLTGAAPLTNPILVSPTVPAPLNFDGVQASGRRPVEVRSLFRYPSYYFRGAPLMATVGSGLLFMLWAGAWSAQRNALRPATAPVVSGQGGAQTQANNDDGSNATQPDVVNDGAGVRPNVPASADPFAAPGSQPNVAAPPVPGNNTGNSGATGTTSSGSPTTPRVAVRPVGRPVTRPGTARSGVPATAGQNSPAAVAPVAPVTQNAPLVAPPVDSGASSTGGRPVNPDGGAGRVSVRVARARSAAAAPVRPASQQRDAERTANNDATAGRSNQAIDTLNNQIQNAAADDADLAYRYQQRATLFLTNGDNARAADDFQMAIAAYQGQIGRSENVDAARSGIAACHSGLRIANARLNR